VEGDAEQPALAAGGDQRCNIQEGRGEHLLSVVDQNPAGLESDENPDRSVAGVG
jgi:hypothetical protein